MRIRTAPTASPLLTDRLVLVESYEGCNLAELLNTPQIRQF